MAENLIADAGVAATPGPDFRANGPERHMRFACAVACERIEDGLLRMERCFRTAKQSDKARRSSK